MTSEPLLTQLIESLRCLPGVGPKTAQRMALHLLERNREGGLRLSTVLVDAMQRIGRCKLCRDLTELEVCSICANPRRDQSQLCIVESPVDVLAIEQATAYKGRYFVLLGRLSPLDGIGPAELGLDQLAERLETDAPQEMIVATNPTVEGEATSYYLQRMSTNSRCGKRRHWSAKTLVSQSMAGVSPTGKSLRIWRRAIRRRWPGC